MATRHKLGSSSRTGCSTAPATAAAASSADSGISLRWFRRTGATVIARGLGSDAAAAFLGHTSTAITEGHYIEYIERDTTVDPAPAAHLERTLRPDRPDGLLLGRPETEEEAAVLDKLDARDADDRLAG